MAFSARMMIVSCLLITGATVCGVPAVAQTGAGDAATDGERSALEQNWQGRFEMDGASLSFSVRLLPQEDGELRGWITIPFQQVRGLALSEVSVASRQVRLVSPAPADAVFEGRMTPDGRIVRGTMTQGDQEFEFTLERFVELNEEGEPERPQTPSGDGPYTTRSVTVEVDSWDIALSGTLTIPEGDGPHPCAVLLSGAGPQDRDQSMFGHKPFAVLADALARAGIATLRCDDRGVGSSTGSLIASTNMALADDALAMISHLESMPEIDSGSIGIVGHSEGGVVGAIAAGKSPDVAFLVLMGSAGAPGHEMVTEQSQRILGAIGMPQGQIQEAVIATQAAHRIVMNRAPNEDVEWELRARVAEAFLAMYPPEQRGQVPDVGEQVAAQVQQLQTPWFRHYLSYNPAQAYLQVKCPTLAIGGSMDLQVDPATNLALIEQALKSGGNEDVTVETFEGVNHMFQPANTGLPAEYGVIETTIDPQAMEAIAGWIVAQTGG